jgi:molybdopterin/thiamine biosynthesis adenylyltransferase/rhodanese-related sulfurtransferase
MAMSREELLRQVKALIREVDVKTLQEALRSPVPPLLVDVREQDEVDQGTIPGARHIPRGFLEMKIEETAPDRSRPVALYCAGGNRSALAARSLSEMGYAQVTSLTGGFGAWKRAGMPVVVDRPLSNAERLRYARHLTLPEVGEAGQKRLLAAKVLLIGAGGLGSPAAYYLTAAGVGTLGLVDDDLVDVTNLQRQILHREEDQGKPKVDSAERTLKALNPAIAIVKHNTKVTRHNALSLLKDYDVIVDGCDNFPTRYLLNDAGVFLRKPVVHGSIFRFEGQATVFSAGTGPCYRCLYPEPPPPEMAPSCTEGGVLGVLPGIIGCIQAVEAIKVLLGVGQPLVGRLLQFDALRMQFRELRLRRDQACPVCGDQPTITQLQDYDAFCMVRG